MVKRRRYRCLRPMSRPQGDARPTTETLVLVPPARRFRGEPGPKTRVAQRGHEREGSFDVLRLKRLPRWRAKAVVARPAAWCARTGVRWGTPSGPGHLRAFRDVSSRESLELQAGCRAGRPLPRFLSVVCSQVSRRPHDARHEPIGRNLRTRTWRFASPARFFSGRPTLRSAVRPLSTASGWRRQRCALGTSAPSRDARAELAAALRQLGAGRRRETRAGGPEGQGRTRTWGSIGSPR